MTRLIGAGLVEGEGERLPAIDRRLPVGSRKAAHGRRTSPGTSLTRWPALTARVAGQGEHLHAGQVQPDFARPAFGIGVEHTGTRPRRPSLTASGRLGPRLGLADIVEFDLVARTAEGAGEDLHGNLPSFPSPSGPSGRREASLEHDDLPDADALAQPVEALVDVVQLQAMGEQLVDRQTTGSKEGDETRHIALRNRRADVGAFQRPLFDDQRGGATLKRLSGWGRPAVTVVPPRAVAA